MKMDVILLAVLYLSGCFICSMCIFHQYHFVNVSMNWDQARNYCRQNYTDLATTENSEELNQLISTVSSAGYSSQVWIGLYISYSDQWTTSIGTDYLNWVNQARNDPLFVYYVCYGTSKTSYYLDENCSVKHPFVCLTGSQMVFVNETVDWLSAWRYCRENYTDLTRDSYSQWYTDVSRVVLDGSQAWIGLFYRPFSNWSDGSISSFTYWDNLPNPFVQVWNLKGVADLQRSGKWRFVPGGTTLPFVCYSISQLRIKSAADLNDPAVKANLLKQFQDRLQHKGVTGVTLKWREQADGKVFHKDEETDVTHDEC
ncbi:hypothetical protein Q5P01_000276 [Channa striata]|uniref:C-type lectin domain-containing protein n=1 Tax=Channa striata TaxID=64152 RepID=A0AA88IJ00_CHASR|nr:hypothetical protein Q5P01_000276 [Channa striata]